MKTSTFSTQASFTDMNLSESPKSRREARASAPVSAFVGGLPALCTKDQLTQFMSQFGYVKEVYISKDTNLEGHKGFAFANFGRVHSMDKLFGIHQFNCRPIEIKRSLQEYLKLKNLPPGTTESDICKAFRQLSFKVIEVLLGGVAPGVPEGIAGVRLSKFYHQEHVSKLGVLTILSLPVSVELHVPKRKLSANFSHGKESQKNQATRPRSFTWKDASCDPTWPMLASGLDDSDALYQEDFLALCQQQSIFAGLTEKHMGANLLSQLCSTLAFSYGVSVNKQPNQVGLAQTGDFGQQEPAWPEDVVNSTSLGFCESIQQDSNRSVAHELISSSEFGANCFSDNVPENLKREVLIKFFTFPGQL